MFRLKRKKRGINTKTPFNLERHEHVLNLDSSFPCISRMPVGQPGFVRISELPADSSSIGVFEVMRS